MSAEIEGEELLHDETFDFDEDFESREMHPEGAFELRVINVRVGRSKNNNKCVYWELISPLGIQIQHVTLVGRPNQDDSGAPQADRRFGKMLQVLGFDYRGRKGVSGSDFKLSDTLGKVFVGVVGIEEWETETGETRRGSKVRSVYFSDDSVLSNMKVERFSDHRSSAETSSQASTATAAPSGGGGKASQPDDDDTPF